MRSKSGDTAWAAGQALVSRAGSRRKERIIVLSYSYNLTLRLIRVGPGGPAARYSLGRPSFSKLGRLEKKGAIKRQQNRIGYNENDGVTLSTLASVYELTFGIVIICFGLRVIWRSGCTDDARPTRTDSGVTPSSGVRHAASGGCRQAALEHWHCQWQPEVQVRIGHSGHTWATRSDSGRPPSELLVGCSSDRAIDANACSPSHLMQLR